MCKLVAKTFIRRIIEPEKKKKEKLEMDCNIFSDASYNMMKDFYKMTSSAFCHKTMSTVILFSSWLRRLTAKGYADHFEQLFTENPSLVKDGASLLCILIGDFCPSQQKGLFIGLGRFVLKYLQKDITMGEVTDELGLKTGKKIAQKNIRGCLFHWRQSVVRIADNGWVVHPALRSNFINLTDKLLKCDANDFVETVMQLESQFERCSAWIRWWIQPSVGSTIFNAMRIMDQIVAKHSASTNNNAESMNRLEQRGSGKTSPPVVIALRESYDRTKLMEMLYLNVRGGLSKPRRNRSKTKRSYRAEYFAADKPAESSAELHKALKAIEPPRKRRRRSRN